MLSIQGLIAKELKKQEKLPEKFNDMVPAMLRIGSLYVNGKAYVDSPGENLVKSSRIISWGVPCCSSTKLWWNKNLPLNSNKWELQLAFTPLAKQSSNITTHLISAATHSGNYIYGCYVKYNDYGRTLEFQIESKHFKLTPLTYGRKVWVKMVSEGNKRNMYYSYDGSTWVAALSSQSSYPSSGTQTQLQTQMGDTSSDLSKYCILHAKDTRFIYNDEVLFYRGE